jgi:phosphatidylethanolamine/phosphatidyl-N-methylethanolamine N-methyltransferase
MLTGTDGFLRRFLSDPGRTGALAPATRSLAQTVASATKAAYGRQANTGEARLKLIELGAGTGALTQGIARLNPVLVEQDGAWAQLLRTRFPLLEVRAECATETLSSLTEPVGVVTSIPMLNNPQSAEIKRLLGRRYEEGLLRFCVLYTYGWAGPLRGAGFRTGYRSGFVARSFPPASVWVYQ